MKWVKSFDKRAEGEEENLPAHFLFFNSSSLFLKQSYGLVTDSRPLEFNLSKTICYLLSAYSIGDINVGRLYPVVVLWLFHENKTG